MRKVLLALCAIFALCANAQWVKPVPKLSSSAALVVSEEYNVDAETYYFWNTEAEAFLGEGNDWNSRTSFVEGRGMRIYFQKYKVDGEAVAHNYYLNTFLEDYVNSNRPRWDWFWINLGDAGNCSTDYKEPGCNRGYPNDPMWDFEINGDNVRIKTGTLQPNFNVEATGREHYLGRPAGTPEGNTIVYSNCLATDNVDWRVVTKADYDAFRPKYLAWAAAVALKAAIDESKAKNEGIDLSSLEAVYNNTNSTAEELDAAKARIPELEKEFASTHIAATVEKPYDATIFIQNPNFEGTADGWNGGRLAWNNTISEFWSANTDPYDYNQTINDLPNGVYKVEVYSFHRIGNPDWDHYRGGALADNANVRRTSQIYANNYWMLNHDMMDFARQENIHPDQYQNINGMIVPDGVHYADKAFNEYGDYNNELFCAVTDGKLTIGIRCNPREQFSWTPSDTWRLTYYGNSADALALLKNKLAENLKDYSEDFLLSELKSAYDKAVADMKAAADYAAVEAAYSKAMSLFYDMEKSRNAYNSYIAVVEEVIPQTENLNCEENDLLIEYIEDDYETILEECTLSEEELQAEEAKVRKMLEDAIKNTVEVGKDYTNLIPNADMTHADFAAQGWQTSFTRPGGEGSIAGCKEPDAYHVGEVWCYKDFDMSYTLTGMPRGIYELEIPAVYRNQANDYTNPATCEIYVNDLSKNVMTAQEGAISEADAVSTPANPSTMDSYEGYNCYNINAVNGDTGWPNDQRLEIDGSNYYIPGSTQGAAVAFLAGRYMNKVYGVVGDDGILKIGFRSKNSTGADHEWLCMGHIKMTYMGVDEMALVGVKDEVDAQAEIYRNRMEPYYQGYKAELDEAVGGLLSCATPADITAASAAVKAVYDKIDKSVDLYKEINSLVMTEGTGLYEAAVRFQEAGSISDAEAEQYMQQASEYVAGCEEGTYDNEAAEAVIKDILSAKVVDVIYIRGGLINASGDDWHSFEYPMFKNAQGKYEGVAEFREERHGNINIYPGHRVLVVFHYLDKDICSADNATRFLNENPAPRKMLVGSNSAWFTTWGGKWKFTIDLSDSTMVCAPEGKMLYKNQIYAVGNLRDNHWALNETTAKHWELVHQGRGIYQGSIAFNDGVERGEVTLFTSDMWMTGNWGESRIGSPEDAVLLADGQEIACNRFEGDRKWILDPAHHYLCTYDLNRGTVRFDVRDLQGDDAEASPLLISDYKDMLMMRSYMRQGETHYFALTDDIYVNGQGWSPLNGAGEQAGKEYERWIHFDGQGHVIRGFVGATGLQAIDDNSFFGVLGGTVKNVGFLSASLKDDETFLGAYAQMNSRSLAVVAGKLGSGAMDAVVENVYVSGNVDGGLCTGTFAGAVEGKSTLKNVLSQAYVNSENEGTSLLVGLVDAPLTLENLYASGTCYSYHSIVGAVGEKGSVDAKNVVDWTLYGDTYAQYHFDGNNHADLQKTVVAFDPAVWACDDAPDAYPYLKIFGQSIVDGIQQVAPTTVPGTIFDLSGRKVSKAQKGLYIKDGRKVIVK